MESVTLSLSREDAMTLEVILDAHRRQSALTSISGIVAYRTMIKIKEALNNAN